MDILTISYIESDRLWIADLNSYSRFGSSIMDAKRNVINDLNYKSKYTTLYNGCCLGKVNNRYFKYR